MVNAWDKVAEDFNTYKEAKWWGAVDNIDAVWPVLLKYIKENFSRPSGKALEFGCGTGMFCSELSRLGFDVTGIDVSEKMIAIGRKNLPPTIKLEVGGTTTAQELGPFDLITSIMVLQFIEDHKLAELVSAISSGGHLTFAVHNPAQLDARGVENHFYLGEDKAPVRIYKRSATDYDNIFSGLRMHKTIETFAETSETMRQKYHIQNEHEVRKYLILGYQKS